MNMKVGGSSPFVSTAVDSKPPGQGPITAKKSWLTGDPFECEGGRMSHAAYNLRDLAGDFKDMIEQATKPFL